MAQSRSPDRPGPHPRRTHNPLQSHRLYDRIVHLCADVGAHHTRDYEGTTLDTLRQMVALGMGASLLPALYVHLEVICEQLVIARPLPSRAPVRYISLVWLSSSPRENTYLAVVSKLGDSLKPYDATPPRWRFQYSAPANLEQLFWLLIETFVIAGSPLHETWNGVVVDQTKANERIFDGYLVAAVRLGDRRASNSWPGDGTARAAMRGAWLRKRYRACTATPRGLSAPPSRSAVSQGFGRVAEPQAGCRNQRSLISIAYRWR